MEPAGARQRAVWLATPAIRTTCRSPRRSGRISAPSRSRVEAVAVVIGIAAGLVAFANWRRSRDEKPGDAHQLLGSGDGRTRFMAMAGMMTSLLFLIGIALAALNLVAVPPCGG